MSFNVPDDWGQYFTICEHCGQRYHLSERGCGCEEGQIARSNRPWLEHSGYTLEDGFWQKVIAVSTRTARKAHGSSIQKGQRYRETVSRYINDQNGESFHSVNRRPLRLATN